MAQEGQVTQKAAYEPPSHNTTLIESLKEQPNFLMEQYNQKAKQQAEPKAPRRAGGVYVPPHKLRQLQQEMMDADPQSQAHQRMMWQLLRKSINGIVNKVNIANIQNIVVELFNENIYRGRGLLARSIIKAQMASPNFTHVYSALVAVINTKVPLVGLLIAKRVIIQFKRSFARNNKIVCVATAKMIAHLVNQKVLGEFLALQILLILLSNPTEDSVEIACDFMIEVGQVLGEITPAGSTTVFERFKSLLHQAEIQQKAQYSIQNLFAIRKTGFKEHPGVIPELDLVEPEEQITHNIDIEEELTGEETINLFKKDPNFLETEQEWQHIKMEILGEENIARLKEVEEYQQQYDQQPQQQGIKDLTQQDLINLRKTIYLAIQSTVNFQQCAHKVLKMNIAKGYEHQLIDMILQCCMMQRIYQSFFGLLAERFCVVDDKYKELFIAAFLNRYNNIFKEEANKIRNLAHLFGHLFHRKAVDWKILQAIRLTPDSTTAAARMFLKIFLKDVAENMGIDNLVAEFKKQDMKEYYQGLFPIENPTDLRFAINYYTAIGLGRLTEEMRQVLAFQEQIINDRKRKQQEAMAQLLQQEEEEMMRLILQQQKIKEEEQRVKLEEKKQREKGRHRQKSRQKKKRRSDDSYSEQHQRRRGRDRSREKQRKRDKDRERQEREKQRQKDKRRRQREREREEEQREIQIQRKRQKQVEKEQKERKEKEEKKRQREKEQKRRKQKQEQEEKIKRKREEQKKRKERSRSKDKKSRKKQSSRKNKRRSSSSETPKIKPSKVQTKKNNPRLQQSSSGLQSSSSDDSSSSSVVQKKPIRKPKISSSSSSSGSSSDSSSQSAFKSKRKRVNSQSS